MARFEVRMTGKTFNACTEQYILFRRAREIAGGSFKIVVLAELVVAVVALILAVTQQNGLGTRLFFLFAAVLLIWRAVSKVQGSDTRNYIKKARTQTLPPEEAEKELVVSFDEEGCTLRALGSTLPGQDVEERDLFYYNQVTGLYRSESYCLVACDKAASICFPLVGLTGGTPEELTAFLEEQCGRKAARYELETEKFQALLR
ncbi:hypothetical protein [Intestinimonas sp. HCP28S3_D6]|uniref:hypothetical protein n=1 Tax=Intestinimonas sp. HCP28S3_D6 TaxID=3438942 RepID=UPI003F8B5F3C